jgi:Tol biopolymer transport system component
MLRPSSLPSRFCLFIALLLVARHSVAQTPAFPSGIAGRESDEDVRSMAEHRTFKDSISADGRFVVFTQSPQGNYWGDIFLRDRYTRALRKMNVAADGTEVVAQSSSASISGNGRHVIFVSCGKLTEDDTNSVCDLYARDLERNTLTRLSVGPAGESPLSEAGFGSISNDGRFVAFTAVFHGEYGYPRMTWLRDRDADQNGIFDEPGSSTTTLVSIKADGTPAVSDFSVAVNGNDARYVAFTSWEPDVVPGYTPNGGRLYIRDRLTNTTRRVDTPYPDTADEGWSLWADFSDDGSVLAYDTTVKAGAGDEDTEFDVYLFDVDSGSNVLITPDDGTAPLFERVMLPSVSGDGRIVAVVAQRLGDWSWAMNAWTYERQTGQSKQVTRPLDGWESNYNVLEVALNQDGSELLFSAYPNGLVYDTNPYNRAVFVATRVEVTPESQTVSPDGGAYSGTVEVRDEIAWSVRTLYDWITVDSASGNGPGTFSYSVAPNTTGESRVGYIWLGNQRVTVEQPTVPSLSWVSPGYGPMTGGTVSQLSGNGFEPGAHVWFGDVEATSVTFIDSHTLEAVTPPQTRSGMKVVKVVNPDGLIATQPYGFSYIDSTPPVMTWAVTGPLGLDNFYVGDVTITWTVSDPESDIHVDGCQTRTYTVDGYFYSYCSVESEGGGNWWWVEIRRDATPPGIDIWWPHSIDPEFPLRLMRGAEATASYQCTDETSGVASCEGDVPAGELFDTSTIGTFAFTVRATDLAGHQSTKQSPYVVLPPTSLALATASGTYGGTALLSATLTSDGAAVAGQTVHFTVANFEVGIAVTGPNGVASLSVPLGTRNAGTYSLEVVYSGDEITTRATPLVSSRSRERRPSSPGRPRRRSSIRHCSRRRSSTRPRAWTACSSTCLTPTHP